MPGIITFKPIEAHLTHKTEFFGKMSPYCALSLGHKKVQGQVCLKGGKHPHWNDTFTVPIQNEPIVRLEVLDNDKVKRNDKVGDCVIDLKEIEARGHIRKWYPLIYKNKPAGEILMETFFRPNPSSIGQASRGERMEMNQPNFGEISPIPSARQSITASECQEFQEEQIGIPYSASNQQGNWPRRGEDPRIDEMPHHNQEVPLHQNFPQESGGQVFLEQRQVVEPHTFIKPVEVVETRPVTQEIEVLEPQKVLKEVQYTEIVPVKKQIEVVDTQVVMKEVEVMEPKLVTKEIQVVETRPVKKLVQVIEPRTVIKEIETFEPQTFYKQVEVTEYVPVMKKITVTEPVTVLKEVDCVEPIITTKTITKEIAEPVIIDRKITKTVGPASLVGFEQQTYIDRFSEIRTSEEQSILEQQRWVEEQRRLEQEKLWEQEKIHQGNLRN